MIWFTAVGPSVQVIVLRFDDALNRSKVVGGRHPWTLFLSSKNDIAPLDTDSANNLILRVRSS